MGSDNPPPLTPDMIKSIRELLGLTQEEAGDIVGGGPRAFQKYESGEIAPAAAVANLLRLLNDQPELLKILRFDSGAKRSTLPPGLAVSDGDIATLSPKLLQEMVRWLIVAETNAAQLERVWVHVPAQIDAPDGGEDGRIEWEGGPARTRYLPARKVIFQTKATAMSVAKCVQEITTGGKVKERIRTILADDGAYVLAVARSMTQKDLEKRLSAMQAKLFETGLGSAASKVRIYSATQLADWVNGYAAVAIAVRERLGLGSPFRSFSSWSERTEHSVAFQEDDRLKVVSHDLLRLLSAERGVARLIGLSGVGKSRLAIETLSSADPRVEKLRSKLLFADLMGSDHDASIREEIQRLIDHNMEALVVVENCPAETHSRLSTMIQGQRSRLSLLTIDMEMEGAPKDETVEVGGMYDAGIDRVIRAIAPELGEIARRRVVEYSAGYPQIARLLTESAANDENLAGRTDIHLARVMALGRDRGTQDEVDVARLISVFGLVRIDGDDNDELKFLQEEFGGPSPLVFRRHALKMIERGAAQRRGGLVMIAPRPVAMALARDQWREWGQGERTAAFTKLRRERLHEKMLRQFARLDAFPEIKEIAEAALEVGGVLDRDDTLRDAPAVQNISFLGEVAPEAAVQLFEHLFAQSDEDALKSVEGGARRNLVWALGKLAFRKETFERAAQLLLSLAVAENEDWGNNATGTFVGLFAIIFGDTESGLDPRLRVIRRALASNSNAKRAIAAKAVEKGLQTWGFSRVMGPETQGSSPAMECWRPQTGEEQQQYFGAFLKIASELACEEGEIGSGARKWLGGKLMGLIQHGLIDEVERAVATVQKAGGDVWIAAIESLQHLLRHEKNVPEEILARVRRLLGTLQPDDLRNQLKLAVTEAPWDLSDEDEADEKMPLVERLGRRAAALGEAVARNIDTLVPLLPELVRGDQRQAWVFGSSLIRKLDDKPRIFDAVILALRGVPSKTRNLSLIGGMVHGVRDTEPALADTVISRFASDAELVWGVPYLTAAAGVTPNRLPLVVELARKKRIPAWHFSHFAAGRALDELSPGEVAPLLLSLLRSGGDYWGVALDLIGMYSFQRRGVLNNLMPVLESVFDTLTWEEMPKGRSSMVLHHFKEITEWLLDKGESERIAIKAAIKLAELVRDGSDDGDFQREDALAEIVPVLLRDFGTAVWPILSEGALGADLRAFKLRQLLGDRPSFNEDEMPPILALPETLLMSWCHAHPERAPAFLARTLPVLEAKASAINRPRTWHPLTRRLIDQFGKSKDVRDGLVGSMHTFGWSGSLTTYYALYIEPLKELLDHPIDEVRLWANTQLGQLQRTIRNEHTRDDEEEAYWKA